MDSSGNVLARDGDSAAGFNFQILVPVSSGTYYIHIEAYRSTTDYTLDVRSLSSASNIATNLTQNASDDWAPVWAPDSQRLAFASSRDGNTEVYVMDADGTNPTNLTQNADTDGWNIVWSPNGQRIAFTSERDGNTEVYVMDADGTDPTNLTQSAGRRLGSGMVSGWPTPRLLVQSRRQHRGLCHGRRRYRSNQPHPERR